MTNLSFNFFGFDIIESEYMVIESVTWLHASRTWRERLTGGAGRSFGRRVAELVFFILAVGFMPSPLAGVGAVGWALLTLLRPHHWRVTQKPVRNVSRVPDPHIAILREQGIIVGHPVVIAELRARLTMGQG